MSIPDSIENERLLELLFSNSPDGFFFMMLDEPVEWSDHVDKARVLDYVFEHQRMTKVNAAILSQFNVTEPQQLLGTVPAQFFAHDVVNAKWRWRELFDRGYSHSETDERRADGTPMRIEGDYVVIHDVVAFDAHRGAFRDPARCHRPPSSYRGHPRVPPAAASACVPLAGRS